MSVNDVASSLITSRKVIFTPSVDIKAELKATPISITCYDRNGNIIKRVTSGNDIVDDGETVDGEFKVVLTTSGSGTTTGSGKYAAGTQVTISANPNSGWAFSKWSDGNTSKSRQLTVDKDYTLEAQFIELVGGGDEGPGLGV